MAKLYIANFTIHNYVIYYKKVGRIATVDIKPMCQMLFEEPEDLLKELISSQEPYGALDAATAYVTSHLRISRATYAVLGEVGFAGLVYSWDVPVDGSRIKTISAVETAGGGMFQRPDLQHVAAAAKAANRFERPDLQRIILGRIV